MYCTYISHVSYFSLQNLVVACSNVFPNNKQFVFALPFQITYKDVFEEKRTFGPVFNDTHFLLPLLKLQKDIESIVAEDGTTFQVIPFAVPVLLYVLR